jgi:hypothetical protein
MDRVATPQLAQMPFFTGDHGLFRGLHHVADGLVQEAAVLSVGM